MLTHDQIDVLRDKAGQLTDPIIDYILRDIAERIAEAGQLTGTAAYQVWRAQQLGISQREVKRRLKKLLKVSNQELRRLLTQSAEVGYSFDISHLPQVQAVPFHQNTVLQQIVSAAVELAQQDFTNLTQTIGMVDPFGNALPLQEAYRSCTDFAFQQVITGAADYTTAIRQATRNLAEKGILVIDYESGVHTSLEAAVRRNIMGGLGLMQEQITQHVHDTTGCDGWEISAHAYSAPDHEPIQGRQYSDAAYTQLNNALRRRIGTLNCGHAAFPILLGISEPQYTEAQLRQLRVDNETGVTVNGRHYTGYEATQQQRKLERAIRRQKRRVLVAEAAGDTKTLSAAQTRLRLLRQDYARFSKAAGLRTQHERVDVAGYNRKQGRAVEKAFLQSQQKKVENVEQPVIMDTRNEEGGADVHYITRLDAEKYKCVSNKITTDEVIITDERIQHIQERHPNDYERYAGYLKDIVQNPQYILEDKSPNTAVILNEYIENGDRFRLVMRLVVPQDPPTYKNSVITFMEISERKFKKYLRNKKILYKAE